MISYCDIFFFFTFSHFRHQNKSKSIFAQNCHANAQLVPNVVLTQSLALLQIRVMEIRARRLLAMNQRAWYLTIWCRRILKLALTVKLIKLHYRCLDYDFFTFYMKSFLLVCFIAWFISLFLEITFQIGKKWKILKKISKHCFKYQQITLTLCLSAPLI